MKVTREQRDEIMGAYLRDGAQAAAAVSEKYGLCYYYAPATAKRLGISHKKRFWTSAEDAIAKELLAVDAPDEVFLEKIGWSKFRCQQRMYRILTGKVTLMRGVLPKEARIDVPEHLWIEAQRRATAPRSLTAILCGDPPSGFTSLDRKQMEGA